MLLQTSADSERRILTIVGAMVILICAAVAGLFAIDPFGGRLDPRISIAIDTPYVVEGVAPGTSVVMHGVEVGKVTAVASMPGGGVRLGIGLQKAPVVGLTDAMQIDFRPSNYFGVTGINITPGAGGQALHDGMRINKEPEGNFTLQALLTRLGELSTGVVTPQLVSVIEKATRYTDALNPLVETMLIAANAVAKVQTVPTARLLTNTTGLSVVFPGLLNATTDVGNAITDTNVNYLNRGLGDDTPKQYNAIVVTIDAVANGLFGSIGRLESSHVSDLLPLVNGFQAITDTVPPLLRPDGLAQMLVELRTRFEKLYSGTSEQRALKVRIVLDSLPGVAAPLGVLGAPR